MSQEIPREASNWLRAFRHKIINLLLGSIALLGGVGLIISFYRAFIIGTGRISFNLAYYLGAYGLIIGLFFVHRIPDRWRAGGFLAVNYVFGILALYSGWLGGSGRTFLLPFIVLAAVLIGPRAGVFAAVVSLATYAAYGLAFSKGWLVYELAPNLGDPAITLLEGVGFSMSVGMVSIGMWFFRQSLNAATAAMLETQKARSALAGKAEELDTANRLLRQQRMQLEEWSKSLEKLVDLRTAELSDAYGLTLEGWARALELREQETAGHCHRVVELALKLAGRLGVPEEEMVNIHRGALLHDIGKMGIPDSILLKPGPLTAEEWQIMRLHPVYAYELLHIIPYLQPALDIPHYHHEHWDGNGYPIGLSGEDIPLAARIFAVIDVWDALLSDRPYRSAWHPNKVIEYIQQASGNHFDPAIVSIFLDIVTS